MILQYLNFGFCCEFFFPKKKTVKEMGCVTYISVHYTRVNMVVFSPLFHTPSHKCSAKSQSKNKSKKKNISHLSSKETTILE